MCTAGFIELPNIVLKICFIPFVLAFGYCKTERERGKKEN